MATKRKEIKEIKTTVSPEENQGLLTYEQVLSLTTSPHLLLGNGFSMSYDANRFSFTTLLESAVKSGVIAIDSAIYKIFQELETADFETVMRSLKNAEKILGVYAGDEEIQELMRSDSENLKSYLVRIITNNHPEKSTSIITAEKEACLSFIQPFKNIYSLNYDLLLYWVTMHNQDIASDGFGNTEESQEEGYVVYRILDSFKVHYIHGAMHYFDAGSEIIKKTFNNTDIPLVEQVRESLDEGKYPIFVSEGTSDQKMAKILHNAYLNHCYKSLKRISGDIVIFGSTLKSNDQHILDAILHGKLKNVYVGVSTASSVNHIAAAFEQYNDSVPEAKQKNLHFYDYRTVNVWGR